MPFFFFLQFWLIKVCTTYGQVHFLQSYECVCVFVNEDWEQSKTMKENTWNMQRTHNDVKWAALSLCDWQMNLIFFFIHSKTNLSSSTNIFRNGFSFAYATVCFNFKSLTLTHRGWVNGLSNRSSWSSASAKMRGKCSRCKEFRHCLIGNVLAIPKLSMVLTKRIVLRTAAIGSKWTPFLYQHHFLHPELAVYVPIFMMMINYGWPGEKANTENEKGLGNSSGWEK